MDYDNCIQCNQCAMGATRPVLLTEDQLSNAPAGFEAKKAVGKELKDYHFRIQVDTLDCYGCGTCADTSVRPRKKPAMKPLETQMEKQIPLRTFRGSAAR